MLWGVRGRHRGHVDDVEGEVWEISEVPPSPEVSFFRMIATNLSPSSAAQ